MRKERESAAQPRIALAGYTNAGKSTLLNALTDAGASVGERLFHTLDPMTRSFRYEGRTYLVTDTVGFIRKLPHQLVEAFKATLEETVIADLIVHVVDASVPEESLSSMLRAADDVLDEIGADSSPRLIVMNKADLIDPERRRELEHRHPGAMLVSAETGEGLDELRRRIRVAFASGLEEVDLVVPYEEGGVISQLHEVAGDLVREDTASGVRVRARVPSAVAERLRRFDANGRPPDADA